MKFNQGDIVTVEGSPGEWEVIRERGLRMLLCPVDGWICAEFPRRLCRPVHEEASA